MYQTAELSANNALKEACDYLQNKGQDLLEVSFDCAWNHVREASQASGEFIFNGELEG